MRVFVGTYNAAASPPPEASAAVWRDWLRLDQAPDTVDHSNPYAAPRLQPGAADVYCLGLQEIVHLNAVNILTSDARTDARVEEWEARVGAVLGEGFVCAAALSVVGTALVLFVRELYAAEVEESLISSKFHLFQAAGVSLGNKAVIGVHLRLNSYTLCFMSCHLPAHRNKCEDRQLAVDDAWAEMSFLGSPSDVLNCDVPLVGSKGDTCDLKIDSVDCDFVFWFGDMNSRMRADVRTADVWPLVDTIRVGDKGEKTQEQVQEAWRSLRAMDQMNTPSHRALGDDQEKGTTPPRYMIEGEPAGFQLPNAFEEAGELTFLPTYKYEVAEDGAGGAGGVARRGDDGKEDVAAAGEEGEAGEKGAAVGGGAKPSEYVRLETNADKYDNWCPAWCDRIFWKVRWKGI